MFSSQSSSVLERGGDWLQRMSARAEWSVEPTESAFRATPDDRVDFRFYTRCDVPRSPEWSGTIVFGGLSLDSTTSAV